MSNVRRHSQPESAVKKRRIWLKWIIASIGIHWTSAIAFDVLFLSILFSSVVPIVGNVTSSLSFDYLLIIYTLIVGFIWGAFQWLVLRPYLRKSYGWIIVTAVGALVGYIALHSLALFSIQESILAFTPHDNLQPSDSFKVSATSLQIATGIGMGIAQGIYLRKRVPNAHRWTGIVCLSTLLSQLFFLIPIPHSHISIIEMVLGTGRLFEQEPPVPRPSIFMLEVARVALVAIVQAAITGVWITNFARRFSAQNKAG